MSRRLRREGGKELIEGPTARVMDMGRCPIPRPRRREAQGQGAKSIPPATERSVSFMEPIKGSASPVVAALVRSPHEGLNAMHFARSHAPLDPRRNGQGQPRRP